MRVTLEEGTPDDAAAIARLRNGVAERLTRVHGKGHWSFASTESGIMSGMRRSRVYVAWQRGRIIATLTLQTKKPWAIDRSYFPKAGKPLYLLSMAVDVELQRKGIGRQCVEQACVIARRWPADAIVLDAYDTAAGAGEFYVKCGFEEVGRVTYRGTPLIYYQMLL
jgi:ribosomal protein S18 acetylase RimI-like enzyme